MLSTFYYLTIFCCINFIPVSTCTSHFSESLQHIVLHELSTSFKEYSTNDTHLTPKIKHFNDNRIKRRAYRALSMHGGTQKRQLADSNIFKTFSSVDILSMSNMVDVVMFPHQIVGNSIELLAVAIEITRQGNNLTVFKLETQDLKWRRLDSTIFTNGRRISFHRDREGIILTILKKNEANNGDVIVVYLLDDNLRLRKRQSIHTGSVSSIILKMLSSELFLVTSYSEVTNLDKRIALYKWRGSHFDLIQEMKTNSLRISVSVLNNDLVLATAIQSDDYGQVKILSPIYKYSVETGKFLLYQKIRTVGATSVNFFTINSFNREELFLLFVNEHKERNISETIIYKIYNEHFQPFQSIIAKNIFAWHPFEASNSNFLLMSNTHESPVIYQYNGWKFEMVNTASPNLIKHAHFTKNIKLGSHSMILSIGTNNKVSIYKPVFIKGKTVENYEKRIGKLCNVVLKEIQLINFTEVAMEIQHNYSNIHIDYSKFEDSILQNVETKKILFGGDYLISDFEVKGVNDITEILKNQETITTKLINMFNRYVTVNYFRSLQSFIGTHIKLLTGENIINKINISTLNGITFPNFKENKFLNQSWKSSVDKFIDNVKVDYVSFVEINNVYMKQFEELVNSFIIRNGLIVNGNIVPRKGLIVGKRINSVFFNVRTILLKSINQHLKGNLMVNVLKATYARAPYINDMTQEEFIDIIEGTNITSIETAIHFNTVTAKSMLLNAFLGRNKFNNLRKHVLIKRGNQEFENTFKVNIFRTVAVNTPGKEHDFYSTQTSNDNIIQEIQLDKIVMRNVFVEDSVNHIHTKDGNLNILLVDTKSVQHLRSNKLFTNIEIMDEITIPRDMKTSLLNQVTIKIIIKYPLHIAGNFIIEGNITVSEDLNANKDIFHKMVSFESLLKTGIKLSDHHIDVPVVMKNDITLGGVYFDTINNISSTDLIAIGPYETLSFDKKMFRNVNVLGQCNGIRLINNVNLEEFSLQVLLRNSDQTIYEDFCFNEISVNRIQSNNSQIDGSPLNMLVTYEEGLNAKTKLIFHKDINVHHVLKTKLVTVGSLIANLNITKIIFDTMYSGLRHYSLHSNKIFYQPLSINILIPRKKVFNIEQKQFFSTFNGNRGIKLQHSISINDAISAYNIIVNGLVDGIGYTDFGQSWLLYEGDQTFAKKQIFSVINLIGNIEISDKTINEYDISYLRNIVKVDDDVKIKTLKTEDIYCNHMIISSNTINTIGTHNLMLKYGDTAQIINDVYNFQYNLVIDGHLSFSKLFESRVENIKQFLEVFSECNSKILIKGKAVFYQEPIIKFIRGSEVTKIRNSVWFSNNDVKFPYFIAFNNMVLLRGVHCEGPVNKVNLKDMAKIYLSKSQNQLILGKSFFNLTTAIFVETQITDLHTTYISNLGHTLEGFANNIWRTHNDMFIISSSIHIDTIECIDFYLIGTVNNVDLNTQAVSKANTTTQLAGTKTFGNMFVQKLIFKPTSRCNGIDVIDWIKNAVYKRSPNQHILGFKEIQLMSTPSFRMTSMDRLKIPEDILLMNSDRIVSGNKRLCSRSQKATYFQNLTLDNRINLTPGQHWNKLVKKDFGNLTLESPKVFEKIISSRNIYIQIPNVFVKEILRYILYERWNTSQNTGLNQLIYYKNDAVNIQNKLSQQ